MSANKKVTTKKAAKMPSIKRLLTYWLRPVWVTLALMLLLSMMVLTTTHFDWNIPARFLRAFVPVFLMLLAFMYILWYLIPIWPLETGLITLLVIFIAFLLASANNFPFAPQIRAYVSKGFDMDFFVAAITIGGLIVTLYAVYVQQRKPK